VNGIWIPHVPGADAKLHAKVDFVGSVEQGLM
jgi:hypothetical protein